MNTKEQFEELMKNLDNKLDDTTKALISEERLASLSAYNNAYDEYEKLKQENEKLKEEKDELLKVNGKLFQKVGFEDTEKKEEEKIKEENEDEIIELDTIINEKGELI